MNTRPKENIQTHRNKKANQSNTIFKNKKRNSNEKTNKTPNDENKYKNAQTH